MIDDSGRDDGRVLGRDVDFFDGCEGVQMGLDEIVATYSKLANSLEYRLSSGVIAEYARTTLWSLCVSA